MEFVTLVAVEDGVLLWEKRVRVDELMDPAANLDWSLCRSLRKALVERHTTPDVAA